MEEEKLNQFDRLDLSHNAGYFETNDSDIELSDEGEMGSELGEEGSALREAAKELKGKSDQFELDMDKELDGMIGDMGYPVSLLKHLQGVETDGSESGAGKFKKDSHLGFYDNVYFDSDEDDTTEEGEKKRVLSNDELLYDPMADEQDEQWVNSQRLAYRNLKSSDTNDENNPSKKEEMPQSDAILSCPSCMVSLCIDCQQHESYKNQFRAMFVMNCRVETSETLKYKKKKKKRDRKGVPDKTMVEYDVYNPVKCAGCDTEVGVYDSDEVFHFYNVLPSEP